MKPRKQKKKEKASLGSLLLLLGGVVLLGVIAWYALSPGKDPVRYAEAKIPVAGAKTLPPEMFTGRTRDAYQVAMDIPQVLNKLPCFCGCMESPGHNSNLFCFADRHGVTCPMCQDIALDAQRMFDNGLSIDRIREHIRGQYGRLGSR